MTPVKRALANAMIAISELPGPERDGLLRVDLKKVDKFTALQLGHSMGILAACAHIKKAMMGADEA